MRKATHVLCVSTLVMTTLLAPLSVSGAVPTTSQTSSAAGSTTVHFSDLKGVSAEDMGQITQAVVLGLMKGDPSGQFRPMIM